MRAMVKYDVGGFLVRLGGVLGTWTRWCHRTGHRMQAEVIYMMRSVK